MTNISIKSLLLRFRWLILFTFVLVTLEALSGILSPLLIGIAVNGLLEDSFYGTLYLSIAGAAALIVDNFCKNRIESYKIPPSVKVVDKTNFSSRFKKIRINHESQYE
jgi:hypothetical protein